MSYYYSFPKARRYSVPRPDQEEIDDALDYVCREFDDIERSNWLHQVEYLCDRLTDPEPNFRIRPVRRLVVHAIFERPRCADGCAGVIDDRLQADITELTEHELYVIDAICQSRPIAFKEHISTLAGYLRDYPRTSDLNKACRVLGALWGLEAKYPKEIASETSNIVTFAQRHADRPLDWVTVTASALRLSRELLMKQSHSAHSKRIDVKAVAECLDPELSVVINYQACRLLEVADISEVPDQLRQLERRAEYIRVPARMARLNIEVSEGIRRNLYRQYTSNSTSVEDEFDAVQSSEALRRLLATRWLISRAETNPGAFTRYHRRVLDLINSPDPDVSVQMIRLYTILAEETTTEVDVAQAVEDLIAELHRNDSLVQESVLRALCLLADREPQVVMEAITSTSEFSLYDITNLYSKQSDSLLTNLLASLASADVEAVGAVMNDLEWFTSSYFINWKENNFYATDDLLRLLCRVNTYWQEFNEMLVYVEEVAEREVTLEPSIKKKKEASAGEKVTSDAISPERIELAFNLLLTYYDLDILEIEDISPYMITALSRDEVDVLGVTCDALRDFQKTIDKPVLSADITVQLGEVALNESPMLVQRVCEILRQEETIQSIAQLEEIAESASSTRKRRLAERELRSAPEPWELTPRSLSGDSERAFVLMQQSATAPRILLDSVDELYDLALAGEDNALIALKNLSLEFPEKIASRAGKLTNLLCVDEEVLEISTMDLQVVDIPYEVSNHSSAEALEKHMESNERTSEDDATQLNKIRNSVVLSIICNVLEYTSIESGEIEPVLQLLNDSHPQIRSLVIEVLLVTGHFASLDRPSRVLYPTDNLTKQEMIGTSRGFLRNPTTISEFYDSPEEVNIKTILRDALDDDDLTDPDFLGLSRTIDSDEAEMSDIIEYIQNHRMLLAPRK